MPYQDTSRKYARTYENALARLPPGNAPTIKAFLERERIRGRSLGTRCHAADFLGRFARFLDDAPLVNTTRNDLEAFFQALSRGLPLPGSPEPNTPLGPATIHLAAMKLQRFFRLVLPRNRFSELCDGETFKVGERSRKRPFVVITDEERDALLTVSQRDLMTQCVMWGLWDTGMRASELVALNVGSVHFESDGGVTLTIPNDGEDLKTGFRAVYVVDSAGTIRAWLGMHPTPGDLGAPLFLGFRGRHHGKRLWPNTICDKLKRLCAKAGIRYVNPHLFRHTRATRAARAN